MSLGALGGALTAATLVAGTPTSSSGVSRLGDGGRGSREAVCVKERVPFVIGVGRRLRGTRGLGGRSGGSGGSSCREAWRARATRERRSWGGGTGGQLLVANPVHSNTCQDWGIPTVRAREHVWL